MGPPLFAHQALRAGAGAVAAGRYGEALSALGQAIEVGPAPVRAAALVVRAGLLREVSLHARAEADDLAALQSSRAAPRLDAAARIGLVADAIGLGSPDLGARLERAEQAVGDRPVSWQAAIRLDWVRGEVAMVRGEPAAARKRFASAHQRAHDQGSLRMAAKSALFEAAACDALGDRAAANARLERADGLARRARAMPLRWPIALLAGDRTRADAILGGLLDQLPEPLRTEARRRTTYPG